jgi:uncharacterized protein YjbI with pentapeptide repeats
MNVLCKYKLPEIAADHGYKCPHPVAVGGNVVGLCVFHLPKLSKDERAKATASEVREADKLDDSFSTELRKLLDKAKRYKFGQSLDMRGFYFPPIDLGGIGKDFSFKPDFSYATFVEYGDLATPRWRQHLTPAIIFEKGAIFYNSVFLGQANFSRSTFKDESTFNGAEFSHDVDFSNATFLSNVEFSNSSFKQKVDFFGAKFEKNAEFDDAVFEGYMNCNSTKFQNFNFFGVEFKGGCTFKTCHVAGNAYMGVTIIESYLYLDGASFFGAFDLNYSRMPPLVSFEKTTFHKEAILVGLDIPKDAIFTFIDVDLSRAQFLDTNLENISFRNVKWASSTTKFKAFRSRPALWDEFRPLDEESDSPNRTNKGGRDYERIAENYRQLVINYERKRDYPSAEAFYIGEMEMRRKKVGADIKNKPWRLLRERLNLFSLYRMSSNYGSSYGQAFLVLLTLFAAFAALFLFSGFQPSKENVGDYPKLIEYNLWPDERHHPTPIGHLLTDYGKAAMFCLSIITFQKDRFYEPVGWQSQLCLFGAVLLITTQAALVLLAVRRQFKR